MFRRDPVSKGGDLTSGLSMHVHTNTPKYEIHIYNNRQKIKMLERKPIIRVA